MASGFQPWDGSPASEPSETEWDEDLEAWIADLLASPTNDEESEPVEPEEFPPIEVDDQVAELVDDLVPDMARADLPAIEEALRIVRSGVEQCALLKELATSPAHEEDRRDLLGKIRAAKSKIFALRSKLESRQREIERAAASQPSGGGSTGFGSWGRHADPAKDRERRAAMAKLQRDTNAEILQMHRETMEARRKMFDQQHKEFLKYIQGRRW